MEVDLADSGGRTVTGRITRARQCLWGAIDATPAIKNQLNHMYRFDQTDQGADPTGPVQPMIPPAPGIGNMPALALWQSSGATPWNLNQSQKLSDVIQCSLWTPHWNLPPAELLWEQIVICFWQTINPATQVEFWRGDPNNGFAIWNMEQGNYTLRPYKVEPDNKSSPWGVQMDWPVTMYQNWNPRTASTA